MKPSERREQLENIARLRRAERSAPADRDIPAVRASLERGLGPVVSLRLAAEFLGVSHTALRRWVDRGDIPTIDGLDGRPGVPVTALLDLRDDIDRERQRGRLHVIESGIAAAYERASLIDSPGTLDAVDPHLRSELRSLAYHEAVARRLTRQMANDALHRVWVWREQDRIAARYADLWEEVLALPLHEIRRAITDDSELGRDLRQNSPFAGTLSEPERMAAIASRGRS